MPLVLMFFATMCVVTVIVNEAMDLPAKRRIVDAGRSRIEAPAARPSLRRETNRT
jgi:hypothetical protein